MDFVKSLAIAAAGLRAQAGRMRVISENIANANSTAAAAGGDPYRRRVATFRAELDRAAGVPVVALGPVSTGTGRLPDQIRTWPSGSRCERHGQIPQCQHDDGNDGHARGPEIL